MKRIHLILILAFAAAASLLLWKGDRIRDHEATLQQKSNRLAKSQTQATRLPEAADRSSLTMRGPRRDPEPYISGMKDILTASGTSFGKKMTSMMTYLHENREFLASASREIKEEIYQMIAASGPANETDFFTQIFLSNVAGTDPAWAISRIDQGMTAKGGEDPISGIFSKIGKQGILARSNWSPEYALALEKWIDTAQAAGRLEGMDHQVAASRFDIAMATGDPAGASRHFAQLTPSDQSRVVPEIAKTANTPDERRGLIELTSKSAAPPAFQELVRTAAKESGFEATRDLLARADLTPENRDLAAAATAGADIGPETSARATWLLESLQSDKTQAITHFAAMWAEGDYNGTVGWLNSLPHGANRDAAVSGFAPVAARLDGASAVDWALTIADSAQRETTLKIVAQTWQQQEPEAAAGYLQEKGLEIK